MLNSKISDEEDNVWNVLGKSAENGCSRQICLDWHRPAVALLLYDVVTSRFVLFC